MRHEQVIGNHLRQREGGDGGVRAFAREDRPPEKQHGDQRDEAEQGARQKIEPVGQVVLNPDVDDVPVFVHARIIFATLAAGGIACKKGFLFARHASGY